jgi:hypothetical protein
VTVSGALAGHPESAIVQASVDHHGTVHRVLNVEGLVYVVLGALLVGWGGLRLRSRSGDTDMTWFLYGLTVLFGVVAIVAGFLVLFG